MREAGLKKKKKRERSKTEQRETLNYDTAESLGKLWHCSGWPYKAVLY